MFSVLLCVYHTSSYSPPCDLKQPGLSRCCSSPVWQGRESLNWLSPRVPWQAWWAQAWGCSRPVPRAGPRDLSVLKQSPYHLFFQCPQYFLVSYLHRRWGAVRCSLCSSIDRLGVLPVYRGKWTLLQPISLPSFLSRWLYFRRRSLNGWFMHYKDGSKKSYCSLPCIMCTDVFGPNLQEKKLLF